MALMPMPLPQQQPISPLPTSPLQRVGPRPLALHLMMGLCASLSLPSMLPSLRGASPASKPANPHPANPLPPKLQDLLTTTNSPEFDTALTAAAIERSRQFIAGIKSYREHPAQRDAPEAPIIWAEGTTCLRDYGTTASAPVILVIPSLINRFAILDLDFAPSFLRSLAASGLRPLVVDWDEPGHTEKNFTLENYTERLSAILAFTQKKYGPAPLHLLGYCMGGLLALALATLHPAAIKTMTLMATPWDFHQPNPAMAQMLAEFAREWESSWQATGQMPVDILQLLFALLQPFQAVSKFADFAALNPISMEARQFVLLEDWLNDGVPLPFPVAHECLTEWYGANATAHFAWKISGHIIDPRQLTMPSYVVVPGRDRIVPPESALPLAKLLPHASLHEPMTGHIGMMASRNASHQVWKPLLRWLAEHT